MIYNLSIRSQFQRDTTLQIFQSQLLRRQASSKKPKASGNSIFGEYLKEVGNKKLIKLVDKIKAINNSNSLDGIKFGHSYFCGLNKEDESGISTDEKIDFITNYEIIPQLKEYLIGDERKINKIVEFLKDDDNKVNVDEFLNRSNNEDEELEDEE